MRVELSQLDYCLYKRGPREIPHYCCVNIQQVDHLQSRRGLSPEADHASTLTFHLHPPQLWELNLWLKVAQTMKIYDGGLWELRHSSISYSSQSPGKRVCFVSLPHDPHPFYQTSLMLLLKHLSSLFPFFHPHLSQLSSGHHHPLCWLLKCLLIAWSLSHTWPSVTNVIFPDRCYQHVLFFSFCNTIPTLNYISTLPSLLYNRCSVNVLFRLYFSALHNAQCRYSKSSCFLHLG